MRLPRWHAPQSVLAMVLVVSVVGTSVVGLMLASAPDAAGPAPTAADVSVAATPAAVPSPSSTGSEIPDQVGQLSAAVAAAEQVAGRFAGRYGERQRTLLLLVRDSDGQVTNAVLLATSDERHGASALLIPPSVLVPTPAWASLASTAAGLDTMLSRNAVSMLLGVRVDASLVLDRLALAALVDAVGGIPSQSRVLDGVSASDYAMEVPARGAESDRIDRFTSVLQSVLGALPVEREELRQLVISLGSLAKVTQTNEQTVAILHDLALDVRAEDVGYRVLPVLPVRAGGPDQVDLKRARELILATLPDAVLQPGESPGVRVLVSAAGATPGQMALAITRLAADGLTVIEADAAPIELPATTVLVQDGSPVARTMGLDVATALGLNPDAVRIDGGVRPSPDVVVWLGRDAPTLTTGSVPAV